jgi:hypothetical protein
MQIEMKLIKIKNEGNEKTNLWDGQLNGKKGEGRDLCAEEP